MSEHRCISWCIFTFITAATRAARLNIVDFVVAFLSRKFLIVPFSMIALSGYVRRVLKIPLGSGEVEFKPSGVATWNRWALFICFFST